MRPDRMRNLLDSDRGVDEVGRATSGDQGPYDLSLSLAQTGKVFKIGLTSKRMRPTLVGVWWRAQGPGWTQRKP
eukprot:126201-Pyramimonas_sp.AAC.1